MSATSSTQPTKPTGAQRLRELNARYHSGKTKSRFSERDEKLKLLLPQLAQQIVEAACDKDANRKAAANSDCRPCMYFSVPTIETMTSPQGDQYKQLIVPPELVYVAEPGKDLEDDGVAAAVLLQGIYDRRTRTSYPDKLPGGKTSIMLANEMLKEHGMKFTVALEFRRKWDRDYPDSKGFLLIQVILDNDHYTERRSKNTKTRTLEEYERDQS